MFKFNKGKRNSLGDVFGHREMKILTFEDFILVHGTEWGFSEEVYEQQLSK